MKLSDVIRNRWQGKGEDAYTQEQRDLINFALLHRYPAPLIGAVRADPRRYGYSGSPENEGEISQWLKEELANNQRLIDVALLLLASDPKPVTNEADLLAAYAFSFDSDTLEAADIDRMLHAFGETNQPRDPITMIDNVLRCFPEQRDAILASYNLALEKKKEAERAFNEPRRGRKSEPPLH